MSCSCIKHTAQAFDFHLESLDCKTLIFTDLTNWMEDEPYVISETHPLTITLPSGTAVETTFSPKTVTKFDTTDLNVGPCLPDGIYCFTVESCGYTYSRTKAVLCQVECQLDNFIASSLDEDIDIINEISNLIQSIKVNADMGKQKTANELYSIVNKKLSKLDCSCPCQQ